MSKILIIHPDDKDKEKEIREKLWPQWREEAWNAKRYFSELVKKGTGYMADPEKLRL